jgi:hypothetical protein
MHDVLYLCYDCIDFHFAHTVLCAFERACLCCILLSAAFIMHACISHLRAGFLPVFVRLLICLLLIDAPPSRGLSFVYLYARRLRMDFRLRS